MRSSAAALCLSSFLCWSQEIKVYEGVDGGLENQAILDTRGVINSKNSQRGILVDSQDIVIPHLVDGGGWATSITLTNLDTRRSIVRVLFVKDDGGDLTLPLVTIGNAVRADVTLEPGATTTLQTLGTAATVTSGWAIIVKEAFTDAIGGLCVFRQRVAGRPDFEAVVPVVSVFDYRHALLFDNTSGFTTAVAYVNPLRGSANVTLRVRGEDGATLETKTINVPGYSHAAAVLTELLPSTAGKRGSVEFGTVSSSTIAPMGLRFNSSGAFTSFHSLSALKWFVQ